MKKIVICSKNQAKNDAVKAVIKNFFKEFETISLDTNSNVSETPMNNEEGIVGCINRIKDAKRQIGDGDLYVAMEGILNKVIDEYFLCGWTVIYDRKSDEYLYGCSSQVHIPNDIINNLTKDERLSDVVAKHFGETEEKIRVFGTNGMLTNGCYTRTDEFTDSVLCAISSKYSKII